MSRPSLAQAIGNAGRALRGDYDLLLACRDLWDNSPELARVVPQELLVPIIGIASQLDGTPLGDERANWRSAELAIIDAQIETFRKQCGEDVAVHLRRLLEAVGTVGSKTQ